MHSPHESESQENEYVRESSWFRCIMAPVFRHCPCLRPEGDDVRILDYSHFGLEDVPGEVFAFERTLEELYLDANQIRDLPRPLFHCHGLRKLDLSDNEILSLPPAIASLINLEELDISKNGILEIPDNIKGCKCLSMVEASVNPLGKLPDGFTQLMNLEELYLNDTFLEYLPASFGRLSRLRILELRENHLKVLPKSMTRLVELTRLDIGQNDFTELPDVLGSLPKLFELWCDGNKILCIPPFIGNLKKLAYFDASKNKISEVSPEIQHCASMTDLTLTSNRLKELPESIGNLTNLTVIRINENYLTSLPYSIGNLVKLEELVVSCNDLECFPESIGLCRSLHTLIADVNALRELPREIGSCVQLKILSLRDNELVSVPDELGHVAGLRVVNLSGNRLQFLPVSIAKLPNLQALWLSENQNKPLIPLQSDTDPGSGQRVLTCFLLPQDVDDKQSTTKQNENSSSGSSNGGGGGEGSRESRQQIKFASEANLEQPGKLVRAPTPYPKELKAHARHARNQALKMQEAANGCTQGSGEPTGPQTNVQNNASLERMVIGAAAAREDARVVTIREAKVLKNGSKDNENARHEQSQEEQPEDDQRYGSPDGSSQKSDQESYVEFPMIDQSTPSDELDSSNKDAGVRGQEETKEGVARGPYHPHPRLSALRQAELDRGYRSDQEVPHTKEQSDDDGFLSDWEGSRMGYAPRRTSLRAAYGLDGRYLAVKAPDPPPARELYASPYQNEQDVHHARPVHLVPDPWAHSPTYLCPPRPRNPPPYHVAASLSAPPASVHLPSLPRYACRSSEALHLPPSRDAFMRQTSNDHCAYSPCGPHLPPPKHHLHLRIPPTTPPFPQPAYYEGGDPLFDRYVHHPSSVKYYPMPCPRLSPSAYPPRYHACPEVHLVCAHNPYGGTSSVNSYYPSSESRSDPRSSLSHLSSSRPSSFSSQGSADAPPLPPKTPTAAEPAGVPALPPKPDRLQSCCSMDDGYANYPQRHLVRAASETGVAKGDPYPPTMLKMPAPVHQGPKPCSFSPISPAPPTSAGGEMAQPVPAQHETDDRHRKTLRTVDDVHEESRE